MQKKIFIVTGVNGIGKSTVIPEIIKRLDSTKYAVHDFDERGVPDNADKSWRETETIHWLEVANQNAEVNVVTIVCGFMKITDIEYAMSSIPHVKVEVCLMDGSSEVIIERLTQRYQTSESLVELKRTTGKTTEKFIEDNLWVSAKFREVAKERGFRIIDTSKKTPAEVADLIVGWLDF